MGMMLGKKLYDDIQQTISDLDDDWRWVYTCKSCIMKEKGCAEQQAIADICEQLTTPKYATQTSGKLRDINEKRQERYGGLE